MSQPVGRELRAWMDEWKATGESLDPPAKIRRHVERRSTLLAVWKWGEVAVCAGILVFLIHGIATGPDSVERAVMVALTVFSLAALIFVYWNWFRSEAAPTDTVVRLLDLSFERCRRLRRAVRFGWAFLIAEVAVLTPWVWYRTRSHPGTLWPWGLLVGLVVFAILLLVGVGAWARREVRAIESLSREIED
ncbi:MAG: hypothetical protein L0387_38080 [Acidobacteria bacterium]|nr:hypothetical protein [Acidobacteriota bacterium]